MERALNIDLLTAALAGRSNLPTAQELQDLMADVEVGLILRRADIPQELINSAWYLHAVASVDQARERYTAARQRQAFQVSAHIFDLALNQNDWSRADRLSFGFAAAIGYRRGGLDPNATAIMNRLRADVTIDAPVLEHMDVLALETGLALLGFETRTLFAWLGGWRRQMAELARLSQLDDLMTTAFGPTHMVVLGAEDLLVYFVRGEGDRLERGRVRLRTAATGQAGPGDLNARWVAAHLLAFSGEAEAGSLWNPTLLPPTVPALVRQAFTLGSPPVLTVWEPQHKLLIGDRSPFDPHSRRMVLAVPTSGGKTLIAQLLAVEHLVRTDRGVCYVAPTRSLCREVRRSMASRIWILQKETGADLPDFPSWSDLFASVDTADSADVDVMTPERLSNLLRHDADAVLQRYGMFVFDEAQLVKERGRGFTLESTITLLDYLSRETDHKIILISAAMGNAGAIAQWLSPDGQALWHESQWRGPRRLHAVFTTKAHWKDNYSEYLPRASKWPYRLYTPLSGVIRLRTANGRTSELTLSRTGWLFVRITSSPELVQRGLKSDNERSTKRYQMASDMIVELGHAGTVLVAAGTREQAKHLAQGLAGNLEETPDTAPLVDFVRLLLGDDHPLVDVLRRGVGFHHGGLPIEVLEALEEAVREDLLRYLTCTSTLTDGVNLPVRTVVIYDQPHPGMDDDARLRGARLINAMGRAGRAGKETEGWIVLVRAAAPTETDFEDLNPDAESLAVTSSLTTAEALDAFANLEQTLRDDEDAIFRVDDPVTRNFISFVWFVLAVEEERGTDPAAVDLVRIIDSTLAAQSLPARAACLSAATVTRSVYARTNVGARRRWPRTGTSIGSARIIDNLAHEIALDILNREGALARADVRDPRQALRVPGIISRLLALPEAPRWHFRSKPKGGNTVSIDPADLLADWLYGASLPDLADAYLEAASDPAWRIEQMVDAVSSHFEHYLAWTIGALVELVNTRLEDAETHERMCPDLGSYIRYGVDDPRALILMTAGIRSRRLAHAIVADIPADLEASRETLRLWLNRMGVPGWRSRYNASASEVLDLLDFTRERNRSLLKTLLESGTATVHLPIQTTNLPSWNGPLTLEPLRGESPPTALAIYAGERFLVSAAAQDQADLSAIIDTGLDIALAIGTEGPQPTLSITLVVGDERD
ncbi:DEAD/DEAH box helicase [Candidatus Protofrankia californiensis]|uniref:DEAD/DEAH box helicase n=1 Tax=Candidatus Protofrankia californiensis TaxID=1839754 RepID=UPI0010419EE8|nr:DEAD/DEAH box helicase [Candidatus Protofrankia californiensis]